MKDCSALDFPFIHDAWLYDLTQNKLTNINWLKFDHSIRWHLYLLSIQAMDHGKRAQLQHGHPSVPG